MEQSSHQIAETPWPTVEGDTALETPFGILSEEFRTRRTNDEFQDSLYGLDDLYKDDREAPSPFTRSLGIYAATAAEIIARQEPLSPDKLSESIYHGSLLGLYAATYRYPHEVRDAIIEYQFTTTPDKDKYPSETPDEYNVRCTEAYLDDIDDQYGAFESLPEAEKPILILIADRACAHLGHTYDRYFIAGVMKSFHQLRPIIDYHYGQTVDS